MSSVSSHVWHRAEGGQLAVLGPWDPKVGNTRGSVELDVCLSWAGGLASWGQYSQHLPCGLEGQPLRLNI